MPKNKPPARNNNQPQQKPQNNSTIMAHHQQWSGPLPPPAALEHFNQIIPNGADRIVKLVEQEQAHRIECEQMGIKATIRDTARGNWIGGTISLSAIAGSVFTAYIGADPWVSVALVSLPVAVIVTAFIKGRGRS